MTRKSFAKAQNIYQLKVTLRGSKPPIWRRIQVADSTSLAQLHDILQVIMGWDDSHLHQFVVGTQSYSSPAFELYELDDDDGDDEEQISLRELSLLPKAHFGYTYDFGDSWEHDLLLEKILPPEPGVYYPRCIKGKLACPPDDCGGIWGYYQLLEAIEDPQDAEHQEMLDWLGHDFDPEAFDLDAINARLRKLK